MNATTNWEVDMNALARPVNGRYMLVLLVVFGIFWSGNAAGQVGGTFVRIADMTTERSNQTATLLADGRVLITGGETEKNGNLPTAELYDPSTGSFAAAGTMTAARAGHTATLLADGEVLIVGGSQSARAEIYDPVTGAFRATGVLNENRIFHAAILLPNGKVLVAGGELINDFLPARAEVYDPQTGTFSLTGDYAEPLRFLGFTTKANLLPDGRVFVSGENPPELYDPATGTFSTTGAMVEASYRGGVEWHGATSLADGSVLITGGNDDETCGGFNAAEIYDPVSGTFHVAGTLTTHRDIHTATLLRDGTVLLTGGGEGWCFNPTLDSAEVYDPARQSFVAVGKMFLRRSGHTATLLNDGTVLIAGGFVYWPYGVTSTAELYRPATQLPRRRIVRRSTDQ